MIRGGNLTPNFIEQLGTNFLKMSYVPHRSHEAVVYVSRSLINRCRDIQPGMLAPLSHVWLLDAAQFYQRSETFPRYFDFYGIGLRVDSLPSDDGVLRLVFMLDDDVFEFL